jgi:hypothetical protein
MVVELCSFYEMCLKVVFKKVVFYFEKLTFGKNRIQLIASEVHSLRQVRMTIYIWHVSRERLTKSAYCVYMYVAWLGVLSMDVEANCSR